MAIKDYGTYLIYTRSDFQRRAGHAIGLPGMSPEGAIEHEGDKVWFTAEEFSFVWRPASRGPLRPGWLPGVNYVAKAIDGQVYALPMREMYETDWSGERSLNRYGIK